MKVRPAVDVQQEDLDDEICLYRPGPDEVLVLSATAADIWRALGPDGVVESAIAALARRYQTSAAAISDDVYATVSDLTARGFLIRRPTQ